MNNPVAQMNQSTEIAVDSQDISSIMFNYQAQAEQARNESELALHQYETLVRIWEASRTTRPGFTADDTIKAVQSTRSTPIQPKAIEDFKYHATTIEWAEARA